MLGLSGIISDRKAFLKQLPSTSPGQCENPLASSMMQSGQSSLIGALEGRLIHSKSLSNNFLVFLFEVKGLAPSTVKGYRSAISRTIHISGGEDFGNNQFISLLVRNFSLERPRQRVLVPQWNIGLVLLALNLTPFEPAEEVDLKFLSYKCCFLLALASGRRRSEVHAFSTSNSCLRFSRDKSSVTLLTDPAFLGKNQIPDKYLNTSAVPRLRFCFSVSGRNLVYLFD